MAAGSLSLRSSWDSFVHSTFPVSHPCTFTALQGEPRVNLLLQVSLANDDAIPKWLAFTEKTGVLFGLAVREDCGRYPLKVGTVEDAVLSIHSSTGRMDGLGCPEGETVVIWADLLLQVDPGNLNADQRVQLVTTIANYLRIDPGSVHLLSLRSPAVLRSENTRVCRQGLLNAAKLLGRGQSAELLWPVGCVVGEQMSDLARILEHSTSSGRLADMLGVATLGWRVLCKGVPPRIRGGRQPLHRTATPTAVLRPPTPVPELVGIELSHMPSPETSSTLMTAYLTTIVDNTHTRALNLGLTQASRALTNSHIFLWLASNLEYPATKSPVFTLKRSMAISSLEDQQRKTFMPSRTVSKMPLEGSTTTPIPLERTTSQPFQWRLTATSLAFSLERSSIPPLVATVGFPFHYTIPSRTFVDPEDGTAESLVLDLSFVEGPPVYFGSWVALDGLALHGVPLEVDLKFAPQQLLLVAQDSEGLTASLPLTLDLRRNQADPCHSFSLTVRRSLHSFLLQRHRVELLLSKLLHFFNDSGSHHLAVLSLAPGSTVVSWYNFTLCQVAADGGKGQGPGGQVDAMWEEMSSENGQISPEFSQAMLPEFPISSVGVVRYRHDCFHVLTTIAPVASTSLFIDTRNPTSDYTIPAMDTTTASGQQTDRYHWMARVVTALLVVCSLLLVLTCTIALFHFCRTRVKARTLAIWPSEGSVPGHAMDLRAVRPRMPPLFQPEVPPVSPRLWLSITPASGEHLTPTYLQGRYHEAGSFNPPSPQGQWDYKPPEEKAQKQHRSIL
uniref:Peptidase S72 domain-containing protein n=1 Tax=Esox lucius TaxID=8010 RepID=A0A6Q2Y8E3_ESOLU